MQANYKLDLTYVDNKPINPADIKQVNLGIRPKSGTPGTYPNIIHDVTFQADATGFSHEDIELGPGDWMIAAQLEMKSGAISDWSAEAAKSVPFPKPNPPQQVSVS